MKTRDILLSPVHLGALLTGAKSFADNPILGSEALNRMGLHVARLRSAEALADWRRGFLPCDAADAAAFRRDGFVVKRDYLPPADFAALRAEVFEHDWPATEMRQGPAVTRRIDLDAGALGDRPMLRRFVRDPAFLALLRHAASQAGQPLMAIQTVIAQPERGHDPQTDVHADTFHSTAKAWFFLQDVGPEDGPFAYVPGSHRLTPARLAWEKAQSIAAAKSAVRYHARGSFRASPDDLRAMGLPDPVPMTVPANTLVIADTMGFHARCRSAKPTMRVELYASHRRNPFWLLPFPDAYILPWLRDHRSSWEMRIGALLGKMGLMAHPWKDVGRIRPDAPAIL